MLAIRTTSPVSDRSALHDARPRASTSEAHAPGGKGNPERVPCKTTSHVSLARRTRDGVCPTRVCVYPWNDATHHHCPPNAAARERSRQIARRRRDTRKLVLAIYPRHLVLRQ